MDVEKMQKTEKHSTLRWLTEAVAGSIFGTPSEPPMVTQSRIAILGAVEQTYGVYQTPTFREMVTTLWNDPLLKEALTMFAEQVVCTGCFLTGSPDYKLILNGKTAEQVIQDWYEINFIEEKLFEIALELKAFGNSLWHITEDGFCKIPIEAVWHALRVDPKEPLQQKYHMQLVPIYGAKILEWKTFIHFRTGVTGYHAPFGQGVIYSLLAKPVDSLGKVAPSIYDMRLGMRTSLHEGFKKFSFGNELWCFPEMSNEDFENQAIGEHIAKMASTGNRIATNTNGRINLAVPERTQSYDEFIKQMRDEFFMALADPSLKLGLEQGFTKATSVTATDVYKFKIATMRRCIKHHFEQLFIQILDKLGYDGAAAKIQLNFGPEETAVYAIADIFAAVNGSIILKNEARKLLSQYHKWDIEGDIEGGDVAVSALAPTKPIGGTSEDNTKSDGISKKQATQKTGKESPYHQPTASDVSTHGVIDGVAPVKEIVPLADAIARYNKIMTKVYIDPSVPEWMHNILILREVFEYQLEFGLEFPYAQAEMLANQYEKTLCGKIGIDWNKFDAQFKECMKVVTERVPKPVNPEDVVTHGQ